MKLGNNFSLKKNDEEENSFSSVYQNLEKSSVIQDVKIFNYQNVDCQKCVTVLTKLIYLIEQGTVLTKDEATECFFSLTKLFQFKHPILRRLCHIAIKSLSTMAKDILIATSSLTKDMTGPDQFIRASAIRALCAITDVSMLSGIERYVKQAIVDKNNGVASSALVSSMRIANLNSDSVKRWMNEIMEIFNKETSMSQYHAFGLFFHLKQFDKLAVSKVIQKYSRSCGKVAPSTILLIRMAAYLLKDSIQGSDSIALLEFIESYLHHRNEIVVYEACRALVSIKGLPTKYLSQTVSVMRVFLSSPRTVVRYSAVSTLSQMATYYPNLISECSIDLESMLSDSNRSLATYAVATLLKIGTESNIDRIIKIVSSFISEITESFRLVIVLELKQLIKKYPKKSQIFLNFITTLLREEGGFGFKKSLVDLVVVIIHENNDVKDNGLLLLCEFIEDCEHPELTINVMEILSIEGSHTNNPSQYIRYIYNRIMLDYCEIRAAAVTCLAKFASKCPTLKSSILTLLKRCFCDNDDEVRDRAVFYHTLLIKGDKDLNDLLIINVIHITPILWYKALKNYISMNDSSKPFTIDDIHKTIPSTESKPAQQLKTLQSEFVKEEPKIATSGPYLINLLGLSPYGKYSHVSLPQKLTDNDVEFDIKCFKHMFSDIIVFEFITFNTLNNYILEDVNFYMEFPNDFKKIKSVSCIKILPHSSGNSYVIVHMPLDPTHICDKFSTSMKYTLEECDSENQAIGVSSKEEYSIDQVELNFNDHINGTETSTFDHDWKELNDDFEVEESFSLTNYNSIDITAQMIINLTGLSPCNKTNKISKENKTHLLLLSGIYRTGVSIYAKFFLTQVTTGIFLKIMLKCEDPNVGENLFNVIS